MNEIRELMRELYKAHQEFKEEWNSWWNKKLRPTEKKKFKKLKNKEPETVTNARDKFWNALNLLFDTKIAPLSVNLRQNPEKAIDETIEFLSIDIPAYRCGYAKEWFLTRLKSIELTYEQKQKLRQIALDLCESYSFRREFNRWCRLMIKLADEDFVCKLKELSESSNRYAQIKTRWMLSKILHHRKDLVAKS